MDKYNKRKHYKPQTLVHSVVRCRAPSDNEPPRCKETIAGFEFFDLNGKRLIGNTPLDAVSGDVQQPTLPVLTPRDTLLDVTNDGTMVSPIYETALGFSLPLSDPILQQCETSTVDAALMTEKPSQSQCVSADIPMVSQIQDSIADQSDNLNLERISDDDE